jgi:phosphatidylserine decarboxylase
MKYFSLWIWMRLPFSFQKIVSYFFSRIFTHSISKYFILPYVLIMGMSDEDLSQFQPSESEPKYKSFQSFFMREFKRPPVVDSSKFIWPCEGYLCEWANLDEKRYSKVKGQLLPIADIFSTDSSDRLNLAKEQTFLNIFLHNHNYHRIHAPVTGKILDIKSIAGGLNFLRPWFYKRESVSQPAFENERLVVSIEDHNEKIWKLALVGGFGVGSIHVKSQIRIGDQIKSGQEIGFFSLGSTVCMMIPYDCNVDSFQYLQRVEVAQELKLKSTTRSTLSVYLEAPMET